MLQNETEQIAQSLLALLGKGASCDPGLGADLDLPTAYAIGDEILRMRLARGERSVGRKIGFTNTTIWPLYGVSAPMWAHVYDSTLHDLQDIGQDFSLASYAEPRIEPEIVFGLAAPPAADMDDAALLGCIEWVAQGFEIVQSVYPGWRFTLPQATAAFGLHGALLVGTRRRLRNDLDWLATLSSFTLSLSCNGNKVAEGRAEVVLGGPLHALRFLVQTVAEDPRAAPLSAKDVVTTGTLTDALPARPGDEWTTQLDGIALDGCNLRFARH